jgi:hypothetical protein
LKVGQREPELFGVLVDGCLADELGQDAAIDTELTGLVRGDPAADLGRDGIELFAELGLELVRSDRRAADFGEIRVADAAEHVRDAPDREAEDEHGKQDLGHPAGGASSQGVEHCGSRVQCLSGGEAAWN